MVYEWLQNIKFIWPENFIFMAIVPFLIWRYMATYYKNQGAFLSSTVHDIPTTLKIRFIHFPFVLRMLSVICLVAALARPQLVMQKERTEGEGIDIVLCLDVSGSMAARDITPSRLSAAKEVAAEFVRSRSIDRIGLVVFSGESFTKCPLTFDKNTVLTQIASIQLLDGGYLEPGTLIGEGLAMAVNRIAKGNAKSRVVILLTDGKEDAPNTRIIDPATAMDIAKVNKVKVYSIGMGGGSEHPGDQIAPGGGLVRDFIDENLLRRIASETGGKYYRATNKEALEAIYAQIDKLEKTKMQVIQYQEKKEMFIPVVLLALCLLFLEVLLRYTVFKRFP